MEHEMTLEDLLDRANRAVMAADFNELASIEPLLERAMERLDTTRDRQALARIRRKAERNANCLLAAGKGVKAALRRLDDVRRATSGLITYDGKGKRSQEVAVGDMDKRF